MDFLQKLKTLPFFTHAAALLVLVLLALSIVLLNLDRGSAPVSLAAARTFEAEQEHVALWSARIAAVGGPAAYEEFALAVASLPFTDQHEEAHLFGTALFNELGIKSIGICGDRFDYGCFHDFIAQGITEEGTSSIPKLLAACTAAGGARPQPAACGHGIGHGLLKSLGYDIESINAALKLCPDAFSFNQPAGCADGVFMEYHFQGMASAAKTVRARGSGMFEPCESVAPAFRDICYFEQPDWWRRVLTGSSVEVFRAMGELCGSVEGVNARHYCYLGVGQMAVQETALNKKEALSLCAVGQTQNGEAHYCADWVDLRTRSTP